MRKLFNVGNSVIGLSWSETFTWCITTDDEVRDLWFFIGRVTKDGLRGYEFICGPIAIIIGFTE